MTNADEEGIGQWKENETRRKDTKRKAHKSPFKPWLCRFFCCSVCGLVS